jgi:pimeloyl-ACP methyl ester carboxylesterase
MTSLRRRWLAGLSIACLLHAAHAAAPADGAPLQPCRLKGVEHEALCGSVTRPLDPGAPQGVLIDVHFALLPALARNKKPDPVFFFAGGPGQSAIALAGPLSRQLARFSNRRDVVLIDQRGTGRSAPLMCDDEPATRPLADSADPQRQVEQLQRCRATLQKLPHGDLRQYTTTIAVADADAVRRALGADQVNVIGGSYGTRVVLEYLRQFPQTVRRAVIDGVAPPDMVLPASFSLDTQSAFDALLGSCEADRACSARYPQLRTQWAALLGALPRTVTVPHPVTGRDETLTLTRDVVTGLVRQPLYLPALASALPYAVSEAAQGRFVPLLGLGGAMAGGRETRLASGMHFSVVCAEDMPRLESGADPPGPDFGNGFADLYRRVCDGWPRGSVPPAFYRVPASPAPVLVLSGGLDPATPPRHGERVATALGANARHVIVPKAGHGVMGLGCMRDVLYRFVDAVTDADALKVDATCAAAIPRPPAFQPVTAASGAEGGR